MSEVNTPHARCGFNSGTVAVTLVAALLACPGTAAAAWVTVGCAGASGGFYDYTSLADAIAGVKAISYRDHYIQVSGTCTEVANLDRMANVTIAGTTGAALVEPPGPRLTYSILGVNGSTGIRIHGLTFRGADARRALLVVYDSTVEIDECVFEQSIEGIFVHGNSNASIRRSIIQDTTWYGIRVDGNANVGIGDVENDLVPTVIRRNSGAGVIARNQGVATIHGATEITDNGTGVSGQSGTVAFCCGVHERLVARNSQGLSIQAGGMLIVEGPLRVQDNRASGISLTGATARFAWGDYAVRNNGSYGIVAGYGASLSLSGEGVIEDHSQAGILLMGGAASVAGDFSVRNNGTPGQDLTGGIVAVSGSNLSLSTGTTGSVTANAGPGLLLTHNSTARLLGATVSGNQAEGVRAAALSSVLLFAPNTITGNGGLDLVCTPNSYGSGNPAGVGRMFCPAFDKLSSLPAGPGRD